ncbi:general stress protein [Marinilactibacillus sp. Marseille-P9653]|uniref:general stress protein n=1 Tax=Marinilactibacillus sp. Marseille-P9653 TaxID=2866583 RepID=UPI001CE469DD|nr:general stress protein [Marinilactibacillus sp. Marseille-P9653]
MDKFIDGSYATIDDALKAVIALYTQGYAKEDLLLVTHDSKKEELSSKTEVKVTTKDLLMQDENDAEQSTMEKIKDTLTPQSDYDHSEGKKVSDLLTDYETDIEQGNTIVLAELNSDVDRDPTTDPTSGYDNHSSIEDPDINPIPQTTDGFKKDQDQDIHIDNNDLFHRP